MLITLDGYRLTQGEMTKVRNRPSRPAVPDPGLQFSGLRIPACFCPRASDFQTTTLQGLTVFTCNALAEIVLG